MAAGNAHEQPGLFTVGHSNHSPDEFIALLKSHGIQVLVDSRSSPYSRYVMHFNREELQAALKRAGIKYLFLGRELGGRPDGEAFYDDEGYVLYHRVAESSLFLHGIERLENGIRRYRVAIMCSEENPAVCHRHLLVGRVMARRGATVRHIRGDGSIQTDTDLPVPEQEQPTLFGSFEDSPWKSLRPAPVKKQRAVPDPAQAVEADDWLLSD